MHTDFICYVIEEYKHEKELDGKTVIALFKKHNLISYLEKCYPALHTVSSDYIIGEIDDITGAES